MADRTEFVGVRVTEDEREKFRKFIDEETDEFDTLSRFLRVTALRYINKDDEPATVNTQEIESAFEQTISPLYDRLDQLEDHIIAIDSRTTSNDKIEQLAQEIYHELPAYRDESELPEISDEFEPGVFNDSVLTQTISSPFVWAQYFDEDIADVRRAFARILDYYPSVDYVEYNIGEAAEKVPTFADLAGDTETGSPAKNIIRRYFKKESD